MGRRITVCLLALLVAACMLPMTAFALGFTETGGYTVTTPAYTLETDEAYLVYNKEVTYEDIDYDDIWTGSHLYVPIYFDDDDKETEGPVTTKMVKDDNIEVSYKATAGESYIESVQIVDGKKEKIDDMPPGAYVKITFGDGYTGTGYTNVKMRLVLLVNKVSYQESRVTLEVRLANRLEYIDENSVYGAKVPTRFRVDSWYTGEATFDMGDGIRYTGRVSKDGRYTIDFARDVDYDIDLMYPDAYLEFYNFRGTNDTFASTGTLTIPVDTKKFKDPDTGESRVYAYEVTDGKRLKALGSDAASYDGKKALLTIRTQSLGHYVLSNIKLKQDVDEDADQTFQSGYAVDTPAGTTEVEEAEIQTPTAAAQDALYAGVKEEEAEEEEAAEEETVGYTSWTPEVVKDPTRGIIQAANTRWDNPSTTAPAGARPVSLLAVAAGVAVWQMKKRGFHK